MFSVPITENVGDPRARDFCERGRERFGFCSPSNQGILQEEGTRQNSLLAPVVTDKWEPLMLVLLLWPAQRSWLVWVTNSTQEISS